jgi:predicted glycosyltransferase
MKILQYCQHVLGIGHFFRTLEILRAFKGHEVILVTGGAEVDVDMPEHVREIRLPELMMDAQFKGLKTGGDACSLEDVKKVRSRMLLDVFSQTAPDVFILELYPFGRRSFAFEINPVLEGVRSGTLPSARVVCSLRDILVEREKTQKYENGVLKILNAYFDGLMVHSDPQLFRLEESFSRIDAFSVPLVYTGFIAPRPRPDARTTIRKQLAIRDHERLVVASAGSGAVGAPLLEAVQRAFRRFSSQPGSRLLLFAGPFLPEEDYLKLIQTEDPRIRVIRFSADFLSYLAAADLSISMAGYNTCMNILAAEVPALVWPFVQNREQRYRAERLASIGAMTVLEDEDLQPNVLSDRMHQAMSRGYRLTQAVNLDGAAHTARWLLQQKKN